MIGDEPDAEYVARVFRWYANYHKPYVLTLNEREQQARILAALEKEQAPQVDFGRMAEWAYQSAKERLVQEQPAPAIPDDVRETLLDGLRLTRVPEQQRQRALAWLDSAHGTVHVTIPAIPDDVRETWETAEYHSEPDVWRALERWLSADEHRTYRLRPADDKHQCVLIVEGAIVGCEEGRAPTEAVRDALKKAGAL